MVDEEYKDKIIRTEPHNMYQSEIEGATEAWEKLFSDHSTNNTAQEKKSDEPCLLSHLSYHQRVWKVFMDFKDAVEYARGNPRLGIIAFAYQSCNSSDLTYVAAHPLSVFKASQANIVSHSFELVPQGSTMKLFVIVRFNKNLNPNCDGATMTCVFNKILLFVVNNCFQLSLDESYILNLDASTSKEFCRHLIYHLPHNLILFKRVCDIKAIVMKTCVLIMNSLKRHKNSDIFEQVRVSKAELESLFVKSTRKGQTKLFVDIDVYKVTKGIRVYGSSVIGDSNSRVVLSPENKFVLPFAESDFIQERIFIASLVNHVLCPVQSKAPHEDILDLLVENEEEQITTTTTTPSLKLIYTNYPLLDKHISTIASPCTIDVILSYENGRTLVYVTKEAGFCHNVGRYHRRNRVMYVVQLLNGIMFQKCHDPDCKLYQSPSECLPMEIRAELGHPVDEWDEFVGDGVCDGEDPAEFVKQIKIESDGDHKSGT